MSNVIPVSVRVVDPVRVPVFLAGTPVQLSVNATHIIWRYVGELTWRNLIALSELGGPGGGGGPANTDELPEGVTNLYFTPQRALDATAGVTNGLGAALAAMEQAQSGINTGLQGQINLKAPLADPVFTGTPTAPNPGPGTNTQQIATTAFVQTVVNDVINGAPGALDTLAELASAMGDDPDFAATVINGLAGKAALVHEHSVADVTGLQGQLDGKAAAAHTHAITDVTGLQVALDGKAAAAHTHDDRYYTESEVDAAQFFADRMFNARSYYRRNYFEFYTDYTGETTTAGGSADGEGESISGTGAAVSMIDGEANRPGVAQLQTGSTATGRAILMSGVGAIHMGGARWIMERAVQFSSLSTSAQRFAGVVGFMDNTSLAQTDGVYFLYDEGGAHAGVTASPNWLVVVASNSTRTIVDTGVAVAATTWVTLRIDINAAGTEALMYIDGVLVHTFTTGLPIAAGRHTGFGLGIHKSVGTTARGISTDYVHVQGAFTTARA